MMDKHPNLRRVIVDFKKLTPEVLRLTVERYPYGYDDNDVISFKNAQGQRIDAVEVLTEDTKYLVKISEKLEYTMANYDESDYEKFDDNDPEAVQDPDMPDAEPAELADEVVQIDLNQPMDEIRKILSGCAVKTRLSLTGSMIVARDAAHAKIKERLDAGEPMPEHFRENAVYYAGPAKTPDGYASGSFGPTTAGRMDSYVEEFQSKGGSFVMLAKGNRSKQVTDACKKYGGFYLGSIGGPAARLAQDCIKKVECIEYPELGMEAIWRIEVEDFPAFIVVDDKGNDFFANI